MIWLLKGIRRFFLMHLVDFLIDLGHFDVVEKSLIISFFSTKPVNLHDQFIVYLTYK